VLRIPELEAIQKAVPAGVEQSPVQAAVLGLEKLRFFRLATAENIGLAGAEGVDGAEVQSFGARYRAWRPGFPRVGGKQDSAFGAAGPDDIRVDGVNAAQTGASGS
jgi:hypothetical protein